MNIKLRNRNGVLTECKVGFSWTNLFFGFLTPLFRADIKWAIIQFILAIVSYSVSLWVFPFFYNKIYIKSLLNKGYYPATEIDEEILINKGFIVANTNRENNEVNDNKNDILNNIKEENLEDINKLDDTEAISRRELLEKHSFNGELLNNDHEKSDSMDENKLDATISNNEKELYSISDSIINNTMDIDEKNN